MGQTRSLIVYFRPFLVTLTNIVQSTKNGKSIDGGARDSNLGPRDGRRRRIH